MLTPQERFFCTVQEKVEKISKKYGTSPDGKINPILPLEQMTKDEREILAVHRNLQTDAQKIFYANRRVRKVLKKREIWTLPRRL